jgi:orotidine-5'-phosphate decarboxylase
VNHRNPIILALDVPDKEQALLWVRKLHQEIRIFKIGMQLFYQEGPDIVRRIQDEGGAVFLDLKLHDIPNTVARACESLLPLHAELLTIHVSGGPAMLEAAQKVVTGSETKLLGITALTSLDEAALKAVYPELTQTPSDWAVHLAGVAQQAGLYGVVCSAQENITIRDKTDNTLCLVNPGIRPSGSALQDQKRAVTPLAAIQSGANYLVIGRPLLEAQDPVALVRELLKEIDHAVGLSA